jgi:hypothetical protein
MMADVHPRWSYYWDFCKHEYILVRTRQEVEGEELDGLSIYNYWECSRSLIEDDELARAIKRKMLEAGVPVIRREDMPLGISRVEQVLNANMEGKISMEEANRQLRFHTEMDRRKQEWIRKHCG